MTLSRQRMVFMNGAFVPADQAFIPLMDRAFLFGDGIYEVSAVVNGRMVDNRPHLNRLERSLKEIDIPNPYSIEQWIGFQRELIERNGLSEGSVYIQVSRGVCERDFVSPPDLKPNAVMFTQVKSIIASPLALTGARVITVPDLRWLRCDIKSTALLAQVLAKRAARDANAHEAWMVRDGLVTEGASSSAFIVTSQNEILTRPLSNAILPGITRCAILELTRTSDLKLIERHFTIQEAMNAREAFYTSATSLVTPVISIDGQLINEGSVGIVSRQIRKLYLEYI